MCLINEPRSSQSNDKKKSEGENFWEPGCSSEWGGYEREGELDVKDYCETNNSQGDQAGSYENGLCPVFPWLFPSGLMWGQASWGLAWGMPLSPVAPVLANVDLCASMLGKLIQNSAALQLDSKGEGSLWFPKTLGIDDPKDVSCDDKSVLIVSTTAIDLSGVDYDSPCVLAGGFSRIKDDQCFVIFGGLLKIARHYGSRVFSVVSSDTQSYLRHTRTMPSWVHEDAGIFDDRGNIDADANGHRDFKNKAMIQATKIKSWALVNVSPRSPTKAKGPWKSVLWVIWFAFNWVLANEPLDIEAEMVLGFLDHLMLGTPTTPLRKIRLEGGSIDAIVGEEEWLTVVGLLQGIWSTLFSKRGTRCPKVLNLRVEGKLVKGNLIRGFAEVAWCDGTPGKGVSSWLRRRWNCDLLVIIGADTEEYRLALEDVGSSLVYMYTPVTEEDVRGEPQYAITDFVKVASPSVNNVHVIQDVVEVIGCPKTIDSDLKCKEIPENCGVDAVT
eukprot:Gb_21034 [translate_table: standard]